MRYLVAVDRRLQQMPTGVQRDTTRMEKVHEMQDEYAWLLEQLPQGRPVPAEVLDIRWMIEELRVSYFAHALGTAYPVSDKRIVKAIDAAGAVTARCTAGEFDQRARPPVQSLLAATTLRQVRETWSCGAVWSARHPVKVEAAGSNPVRTAVKYEKARASTDAGPLRVAVS